MLLLSFSFAFLCRKKKYKKEKKKPITGSLESAVMAECWETFRLHGALGNVRVAGAHPLCSAAFAGALLKAKLASFVYGCMCLLLC